MPPNHQPQDSAELHREMTRLLDNVCSLAATWRGAGNDPQHRDVLVAEYHASLAQLEALGWRGHLDWDCELPDELMPETYRHVGPPPNWSFPGSAHQSSKKRWLRRLLEWW